jgi:hypothetical protein
MSSLVFSLADIASLRIPAPGLIKFFEATSARADIVRHSLAISRRSTLAIDFFKDLVYADGYN